MCILQHTTYICPCASPTCPSLTAHPVCCTSAPHAQSIREEGHVHPLCQRTANLCLKDCTKPFELCVDAKVWQKVEEVSLCGDCVKNCGEKQGSKDGGIVKTLRLSEVRRQGEKERKRRFEEWARKELLDEE